MLTNLCPGVVMLGGCGELLRAAFLDACRRHLEEAGYRDPVLVRTRHGDRVGLWVSWWAVGVSSAGTLADCQGLVGEDEELVSCHGRLIIYTPRPGAWIGVRGSRIRSLSAKWCVPIEVRVKRDA